MAAGNPALEAALSYARRGWSVVPLHSPRPGGGCTCGRECGSPGKHPRLPAWKEYQSRVAGEVEIRSWWERWPDANVAIVTGAVSGLIVVDLDGEEALWWAKERGVPPTPAVVTGKGVHLYFAHPGRAVPNVVRLAEFPSGGGVDLRGDGGLATAPPSLHFSGRRYAWASNRPFGLPLALPPEWLLELLEARAGGAAPSSPSGGREPGWVLRLLEGVEEGQRDEACVRLAGHYLRLGVPEDEVLVLLLAWNRRNRPPLPEKQVEKCVRSIARREVRKQPRPAGAGGGRKLTYLPGRVAVPPGWDQKIAVVTISWDAAREAYRQGKVVVVAYPDFRIPPEAAEVLSMAERVEAVGSEAERAELEWNLIPLLAIRGGPAPAPRDLAPRDWGPAAREPGGAAAEPARASREEVARAVLGDEFDEEIQAFLSVWEEKFFIDDPELARLYGGPSRAD